MHYVENGQNFQNQNYPNQGYNNNNSNQPFRSNFNGQEGGQFPRYNNFNQGNQRPFFPNNTSGPQQSRPYNGNGGGFNRPYFQSGDQGKTSNYQGIELQKLERLETLIIKSMEEMRKSALEQSKRIDAIGSNFEQIMVGWDEKLDKIASKVKSLEGKIADVATSMKPFGNGILPRKPKQNPKDFSQFTNGDEGSSSQPRGVRRNFKITIDHRAYKRRPGREGIGSNPAIPIARNSRLAFPSTMERARIQRKAYANIIRALNLMESTVELDSMLESDSEFTRNYHIIKENKEWYEDKVHTLPIKFSKLFKLPHEYFAEASHTLGDLDQVRYVVEKLAQSELIDEEDKQKTLCLERGERNRPEDPRCFVIPCFVNNIPFRTCVLDLGASKSVIPLDISIALGINGLERARSSLVLADWSTRKLAGIAR